MSVVVTAVGDGPNALHKAIRKDLEARGQTANREYAYEREWDCTIGTAFDKSLVLDIKSLCPRRNNMLTHRSTLVVGFCDDCFRRVA